MIVKEFLILSDVIGNRDEVLQQIKQLPKPDLISGKRVPDDLNDLTIGQLMELQSISSEVDCLFVPCHVVLGIDNATFLQCKIEDILAFSAWVTKEIERITRLFESTSIPPTIEEKRAGVDQLSFGLFGLVDYYATRMGITDHERVEGIPWVRVYKCLDMDAGRIRYERRLRDIYQNQK